MNILLLREVISINPYSYSRKKLLKLSWDQKPWQLVASNLKVLPDFNNQNVVTARACQDHTKLLLKHWKASESAALNRYVSDNTYANTAGLNNVLHYLKASILQFLNETITDTSVKMNLA